MQGTQPGMAEPADGRTVTFGPLMLNLDGYTVSVAGQDVPVTFTEFLLLKELTRTPYNVLDRVTLAKVLKARGSGHEMGPASLRTVDLHISRLRRKLSEAGCDCIKTMRFVGYRFVPTGLATSP